MAPAPEGAPLLDITRIDHISMAVPDLDAQVTLLEGFFGFHRTDGWVQDRAGYRGASLHVPGSSAVAWEVLAPDREDCYIQRFLDGPNGPGLHHVALQVPDVGAAADELRGLGIEPWGPALPEPDGWGETYIHPRRGGHGFLFQFYQSGETAPRHDPGRWFPPPDAPHTLGITAVNHLSHAHPDREQLGTWYERVFGMRTFHQSPGVEQADFLTRVLETPTGQMRWEILQPARPDSFVQRFLDARGPAMHHVTFEVGDWERAVLACEHHGVPTFGDRAGVTDGARWREAFIHPRYTGGFLAQIFWEERPGVWI